MLMGEASTAWIKCRTEDYWAHLFRCVLVFRYTILTNSLSTSRPILCRILQSFKIDSDTRQQNRLKPKLSHSWNRCLNMKNKFQWLLLLLIMIVIYVTVEKYPIMNPQNSEENTTGMSKRWCLLSTRPKIKPPSLGKSIHRMFVWNRCLKQRIYFCRICAFILFEGQ